MLTRTPLSFPDLIGVQSWTGRFGAEGLWEVLRDLSDAASPSLKVEPLSQSCLLPPGLTRTEGSKMPAISGAQEDVKWNSKEMTPEILSNVFSLLSLHSKTFCENIPMWEDQKLAIRLSSESTDGQTEDAVRPHHHGGGGPASLAPPAVRPGLPRPPTPSHNLPPAPLPRLPPAKVCTSHLHILDPSTHLAFRSLLKHPLLRTPPPGRQDQVSENAFLYLLHCTCQGGNFTLLCVVIWVMVMPASQVSRFYPQLDSQHVPLCLAESKINIFWNRKENQAK